MSFLQPILLVGLPLALLPVIIHLINQHRHRTVRWAAMMFLLDAKKMTKGLARLRQLLILAMRVLAIAALVFAASRPLAGGWIGLAGGKADTLVILLDRSASMEQRNLETGESKRSAALERLAGLVDTTGHHSEIILVDSATLSPIVLTDAQALNDLPETGATATAANIPAMLRTALDYLETREAGRTDMWLVSDLRQSDWNPGSGEWETLRADLAARESLRLFLLAFPGIEQENLSLAIREAKRQRAPEGWRLVLDLVLKRQGPGAESGDSEVPVEFTINGTRTVENFRVSGPELVLLGHSLPLSPGNERGWGRLDLPADDNPADNTAFFVFDEPAPRKTVILSDDPLSAEAIRAAAASPTEPGTTCEALVLPSNAVAQVPWQETALLFWHAPLPQSGSADATLLQQHVASGRSLVLLPPSDEGGAGLFGVKWGDWIGGSEEPLPVDWWRTETGLLANTRSGAPLPVAELGVFKTRAFSGEILPLLRLKDDHTMIARVVTEAGEGSSGSSSGSVYLWGTLPRADHSNLATEGVAFFVMVHRALEAGANAVSKARSLVAGKGVLGDDPEVRLLDGLDPDGAPVSPGLAAGAWESGPAGGETRLLALNRPESEDDPRVLTSEALETLLAGVDYRRIDDEVGSGSSLASEVWRAFLVAMALALLVEAVLCLPPRAEGETPNPLKSAT
ncbi:MAG: BatA domain-containing protein [Verrucomicrobiae bacterium]|nr:BatA domain-containing protein [Verrucomicrobiae bacterium]